MSLRLIRISEQRNNVHVYMQNGASLQSQIVNLGIQYGVNMSRTLAAKDATYTPGTNGNGPYVDTTGFPDNATIYTMNHLEYRNAMPW